MLFISWRCVDTYDAVLFIYYMYKRKLGAEKNMILLNKVRNIYALPALCFACSIENSSRSSERLRVAILPFIFASRYLTELSN